MPVGSLGGNGHAEGSRDGVRGMSADKGVVFALLGRGEGHDAVQFTVGGKLFPSAGQNLVAVGLVPHIPYDTVVGGIEDIVQCHGCLHHTEAGGEVSGIDRQFLEDVLSEFFAEGWQLLHLQFAQVAGIFDLTQKVMLFCVHVFQFLVNAVIRISNSLAKIQEKT